MHWQESSLDVPQGQVLGRLLFLSYILPTAVESGDHDTQLYMCFSQRALSDALTTQYRYVHCIMHIKHVEQQMTTNMLKLNNYITEVLQTSHIPSSFKHTL